MKLMVQCPQVNHHLLLPLRELMTFVSEASQFDNKKPMSLIVVVVQNQILSGMHFCIRRYFVHLVWCTCDCYHTAYSININILQLTLYNENILTNIADIEQSCSDYSLLNFMHVEC